MEDVAQALSRHAAVLARFEARAERLLAAGEDEDALACAQLAAHVAWLDHPGTFASPRLEAVCQAVGERLHGETAADVSPDRAGAGRDSERTSSSRPRVLHVLSEPYEVGGHTRTARRWIELDADHDATVHLTRHSGPVPAALGHPAEANPPGTDMRERAAHLRRRAAEHDLVVLHVHPDDPIPLAAFPAGLPRPPLVHFNHADHCFWLGRCLPDLLVDYRATGTRIAVTRRGIPAARCVELALPMDPPAAGGSVDRAAARHALGIARDEVVLLSIGSAYKFDAPAGRHLLDVLEPTVAALPKARMLAVGPGQTEPGSRRDGPRTAGSSPSGPSATSRRSSPLATSTSSPIPTAARPRSPRPASPGCPSSPGRPTRPRRTSSARIPPRVTSASRTPRPTAPSSAP